METSDIDKTYQVISLGVIDTEADIDEIIQQLESKLALDYYPASLICKHGHPVESDLSQQVAQELVSELEACGIRGMLTVMSDQDDEPESQTPQTTVTPAEEFATAFQLELDEEIPEQVVSVSLAKNTLKLWRERLPEIHPRFLYPHKFTLKTATFLILGMLLSSFIIGPSIGLLTTQIVDIDVFGILLSFAIVFGAIGLSVGITLHLIYQKSHNAVFNASSAVAGFSGAAASFEFMLYYSNQYTYNYRLLELDLILLGALFSALLALLVVRYRQHWFYEYENIPLTAKPLNTLSLAGTRIASMALAKNNFNAFLSAYKNYPGHDGDVILHSNPDSPISFIEIKLNFMVHYQRPKPKTLQQTWCITSQQIDQTIVEHLLHNQVMSNDEYFQYMRENPHNMTVHNFSASTPLQHFFHHHHQLISTLAFGSLLATLAFHSFDQYYTPPVAPVIALPTPEVKPIVKKPEITLPKRDLEQERADQEEQRQYKIYISLKKARYALKKNDLPQALEHIEAVLDKNPDHSKARYLFRKVVNHYAQDAAKALRTYNIEKTKNIVNEATSLMAHYPDIEVPEINAIQQRITSYFALEELFRKAELAFSRGDIGNTLIYLTSIQQQDKNFPDYPALSHKLAEHYVLLSEKELLKRHGRKASSWLHRARQISQQFDLDLPSITQRQKQLDSWGYTSVLSQRKRYIGKQVTINFTDGRSLRGKIIALDNDDITFRRNISGTISTSHIDWLDILKIN